MASNGLNRRDFNRLTAAALSGMVGGAIGGCGGKGAGDKGANKGADGKDAGDKGDVKVVADDAHICRGLNACKNLGRTKDNACAGQGDCATVKAHNCGGLNECRGQGACGKTPGQNDCKGKGGCAVPVTGDMWTDVRKKFDARMKEGGKPVGNPPPE